MSSLTNAVCFTCGLVIESPPILNRLTTGQVCPACRERVLEGLPPALPSRPSVGSPEGDSKPRSGQKSTLDDQDPGVEPGDWDRAS